MAMKTYHTERSYIKATYKYKNIDIQKQQSHIYNFWNVTPNTGTLIFYIFFNPFVFL